MKTVCLEISLKPFGEKTETALRAVCERIYRQWLPLFKDVECVSVMFWTADGSELLDYRGNLDDKFEWAKYIGGGESGGLWSD